MLLLCQTSYITAITHKGKKIPFSDQFTMNLCTYFSAFAPFNQGLA